MGKHGCVHCKPARHIPVAPPLEFEVEYQTLGIAWQSQTVSNITRIRSGDLYNSEMILTLFLFSGRLDSPKAAQSTSESAVFETLP